MNTVVFSLGSIIEDRFSHIKNAIDLLKSRIGSLKKTSRIYETPPFGFNAEINFLNLCIEIQTGLNHIDVLSEIQKIESELGRIRNGSSYTSRTIDIDIIFFNELKFSSEKLTIPHPEFHKRKFVLQPLNDLDGQRKDPNSHLTVQQLLVDCIDKSAISMYKKQILV